MRARVVLAAAVAAAAVGAGHAPGSVTVDDPCGDLVTFAPQPEEWDRNDLAGLTLEEVTDANDAVLGIDIHVETCGEAEVPSRFGEYLEVQWPLEDGCWASAAVGSDGNEVTPVGGTTVQFAPGAPRFAIRCVGEVAPYDLVTTASDRAVAPLAEGAVTRDGTRTTISLRRAELGEVAALLAPGTTIVGARAVSHAMYGTTVVFGTTQGGGSAGTVDWTSPTGDLTLGG